MPSGSNSPSSGGPNCRPRSARRSSPPFRHRGPTAGSDLQGTQRAVIARRGAMPGRFILTSVVHRRKIRMLDTYFKSRHPPIFAATDGGRDMASNPVETADPVDAAETPALVDHII